MATKKTARKAAAGRFFARQLAREKAPSAATAAELYQVAGQLCALRPWTVISDTQLVVAEAPGTREPCFCSIMGALGQVRALHVYMGMASYPLFQKMRDSEPLSVGSFLAGQKSVSTSYVTSAELTAPDRELLTAMGHPKGRGMVFPQFRAIRPGYHPWYPTDDEARVLIECHYAVIAAIGMLLEEKHDDWWPAADVYPLITVEKGAPLVRRLAVTPPVAALPQVPPVDPDRVERLRKLPRGGTLQLDHFYVGAKIGRNNDRKSCMRVALVIDADTAFAFPPVVKSPEASTGEMLAEAVLTAVEVGRARPAELQVRESGFKAMLTPLARSLEMPVRIVKSMPALEFASQSLMTAVGDSPLGGE